MGLSNQLISQFVKATNDEKKATSKEVTVYGTTVKYDGRMYVKLDGSELLTPVKTTASVNEGDKVTVVIGNHTATIIGNMSDPAASSNTVEKQGSKINEFEIVMAYKVTTEDLEAVNAAIENLKATAAKIQDATIINAEIEKLTAKFADLEYVNATDIEAITANIESIHAKFGDYEELTTEDLKAVDAEIDKLKGYTADFTYVSADVLDAMKASIKTLDTEKLSAKDAELIYANIDFSNIGEAAVKKLFTESGIIKNLVMSEGAVTGELVGVTIKGDLIKGNTIVADKLVIKGKDGIYYKLNMDAGSTTTETITEEDLQNGLDGSVIIAKSVTAEKVNVDDLVAFGATIGGFHITGSSEDKPGSIYSGTKESVNNTTRGSYLDDKGQVALGDASNFIRFYEDEDGYYHLVISAESIIFGSTGKTVESALSGLTSEIEHNQTLVTESTLKIEDIKSLLRQIVTDENGQSLMITTEETYVLTDEIIDVADGVLVDGAITTTGEEVYFVTTAEERIYYSIIDSVCYKVIYNPETCTFNVSDIENAINSANNNVSKLSSQINTVDNIVNQIQKTVTDLSILGGYVVINENFEVKSDDGTVEKVPAIILGASDSDFKVIITNKQIAFYEGSTVPAYISGQTLIAQRIEIKVELAQTAPDSSGQFIWKIRANGNYGLSWKEGVK